MRTHSIRFAALACAVGAGLGFLLGEGPTQAQTLMPKPRVGETEVLPHQRRLTGEEAKQVEALEKEIAKLQEAGKFQEALGPARKALEIRLRAQGERHWQTADAQRLLQTLEQTAALSAEARAELVEAAALSKQADALEAKARYAQAIPLQKRALEVVRKYFGEDHRQTAYAMNFLGVLLSQSGQHAEAAPLLEKALAIRRKVLGEDHPDTATSYNNLAHNLNAQGKYAEAAPLLEKALAICRKILGEDHPQTATSYNNLAANLNDQGKYAAAAPLYEKALAIRRRALGEGHRDTATSYNNLAMNLKAQGKYAEAAPLYEKALAIFRRALGEDHPHTATSYSNLAYNLHHQGRYAEAERFWVRGTHAFEVARWRSNTTGLDRAAFATRISPFVSLTGCLARNHKPAPAWQTLEAGLARGLLDEVSGRSALSLRPEDRQRQQGLTHKLDQLDRAITQLMFAKDKTEAGQDQLRQLLRQRQAAEGDLARWNAELTVREVYDLGRIQAALAPDSALIAWVDVRGEPHAADPNGEHWTCVLRRSGAPAWVKLPGSGPKKAWTKDDNDLPAQVREALARPGEFGAKQELLAKLRTQRLDPLKPHLQATADLPDVRHLVVLPAGWMAGVPLEALTDAYAITYAPSGTMFAKLRTKPPASIDVRLLAVGDPAFAPPEAPPKEAPPPDHGVLLTSVVPGANAAQHGVRSGDVLLRYGTAKLTSPKDLTAALRAQAGQGPEATPQGGIAVQIWREGQTLDLTVRPGPLGVYPDAQPAAQAVRSRRDADRAIRASHGPAFERLPGTRVEVQAIAGLFDKPLTLLDAEATEQRFAALAKNGELTQYRYLHLATHGDMNDRSGLQSALILSPNPRTDADPKASAGLPVQNSRLTAEEIREHWKLDAELVTLSACQTGLGRLAGGEGYLGFTQALFTAGARSLVVSLWKVDDVATALLMRRFYQNLLGKRGDGKPPLPKAEALREAKQWLQQLTKREAEQLEAQLPKVERGGERSGRVPVGRPEHRPYADPYYWAAFILIGDPN